MRKIVNSYYEDSGEPDLVRKAVVEAWSKEQDYNDQVEGSGNALLAKWRLTHALLYENDIKCTKML